MKVVFTVGSTSRRAGGLFESVRALSQGISRTGVDVAVLALRDPDSETDRAAWDPVPVRLFRPVGPRRPGYCPALINALIEGRPDLAHAQGIWQTPSMANLAWTKRTGKPQMVSPRGMLDGWALGHAGWKKRVVALAFERRHLVRSSCIHALGEPELRAIRAYGLSNPVCVIPNGVALPADEQARTESRDKADRRTALFLGRFHRKKGLEELLRGWAAAYCRSRQLRDGWRLALAGWDDGGYAESLERMVRELNLGDSVELLGPVYGDKKAATLAGADLFILPSFSEGLPMAVLEAWAFRLPVLMTAECNLGIGFERGAAFECRPDAESVSRNLEEIARLEASDMSAMGLRGRALVEERFSWDKIAIEMVAVYGWLLGGGPVPESVSVK